MYTKYCVMLQRSRAKDDKNFLHGTRRWFHGSGAEKNWSGQRRETHRNQWCELFSAVGKRAWQSGALVSPAETLNKDVVPIGDDTEPSGAPREKVELGNDEDEEPLEAAGPRARTDPTNPTSGEKQEHEESGNAVYRNWCAFKDLGFRIFILKRQKTDHKITSRCSDSNSEFAVNGEKLALHEAEADVKKKTKKNSDIALHEINQDFKSQ